MTQTCARSRDVDEDFGSLEFDIAPLPRIDAGCRNLPLVTSQAWRALRAANVPTSLFRFGGIPVRIEYGDKGEPVIRTLDHDRMKHHLARSAEWFKVKREGRESAEVAASPPNEVVADVLATPDQPLPVLSRIVEAPVFAPDGTLQTTPGYHPASQTFYAPAPRFTVPDVPERPTGQDVESARTLICDDLLGDFPFVGDAERAHAVALLLLPRDELPPQPLPIPFCRRPLLRAHCRTS